MLDLIYIKSALAEGHSPTQIAASLGTYPKKIIDFCKANGIPLPTRSESVKNAIKKGLLNPGVEMTDNVKIKIATSVQKSWTDEKRSKQSKIAKENWAKKTPEELDEFNLLGKKKIVEAARKGSKLERELMMSLGHLGTVVWHEKIEFNGNKLEADLMIPSLNLAIEIDGISHYEPIHGQEKLDKVRRNDIIKNELYRQAGYRVIRIKNVTSHFGLVKIQNLTKKIEDFVNGTGQFITLDVE